MNWINSSKFEFLHHIFHPFCRIVYPCINLLDTFSMYNVRYSLNAWFYVLFQCITSGTPSRYNVRYSFWILYVLFCFLLLYLDRLVGHRQSSHLDLSSAIFSSLSVPLFFCFFLFVFFLSSIILSSSPLRWRITKRSHFSVPIIYLLLLRHFALIIRSGLRGSIRQRWNIQLLESCVSNELTYS